MNLENIKAIVNSDAPYWETLLINELAKDENVVPLILELLSKEREIKKSLLTDSNSELSRALVTILDDNYGRSEGKNKAFVDRIWVAGEIKKHYLKWKDFIHCCFKIDGLP